MKRTLENPLIDCGWLKLPKNSIMRMAIELEIFEASRSENLESAVKNLIYSFSFQNR